MMSDEEKGFALSLLHNSLVERISFVSTDEVRGECVVVPGGSVNVALVASPWSPGRKERSVVSAHQNVASFL